MKHKVNAISMLVVLERLTEEWDNYITHMYALIRQQHLISSSYKTLSTTEIIALQTTYLIPPQRHYLFCLHSKLSTDLKLICIFVDLIVKKKTALESYSTLKIKFISPMFEDYSTIQVIYLRMRIIKDNCKYTFENPRTRSLIN